MNLPEVLAQHRPYGLDCSCYRPINSNDDWSRHANEAWREACTIRTVEQLDALPEGAIVRDRGGRVFEQTTNWRCAGKGFTAWWSETGEEGEASSDELNDLPALLIWNPNWEAR